MCCAVLLRVRTSLILATPSPPPPSWRVRRTRSHAQHTHTFSPTTTHRRLVQILDLEDDALPEDGAAMDLTMGSSSGKAAVIKTTTRQTVFLPVVGLVRPEEL